MPCMCQEEETAETSVRRLGLELTTPNGIHVLQIVEQSESISLSQCDRFDACANERAGADINALLRAIC